MNQAEETSAGKRFAIGLIGSFYLIGTFLYRAFTPAHEGLLQRTLILTMILDALVIVGLVGLRKSIPAPLFWIALIAGLALFGIRLTDDDSWRTGHIMFSLRSD